MSDLWAGIVLLAGTGSSTVHCVRSHSLQLHDHRWGLGFLRRQYVGGCFLGYVGDGERPINATFKPFESRQPSDSIPLSFCLMRREIPEESHLYPGRTCASPNLHIPCARAYTIVLSARHQGIGLYEAPLCLWRNVDAEAKLTCTVYWKVTIISVQTEPEKTEGRIELVVNNLAHSHICLKA